MSESLTMEDQIKRAKAAIDKLTATNDVLIDVNMQINDLMAVYTDAPSGADIVATLRKILLEYESMKIELAAYKESERAKRHD